MCADPQRRVTVAVRLKWDPGLILITVGCFPVRTCIFVPSSVSVNNSGNERKPPLLVAMKSACWWIQGEWSKIVIVGELAVEQTSGSGL